MRAIGERRMLVVQRMKALGPEKVLNAFNLKRRHRRLVRDNPETNYA
jgi:hypothetical protein